MKALKTPTYFLPFARKKMNCIDFNLNTPRTSWKSIGKKEMANIRNVQCRVAKCIPESDRMRSSAVKRARMHLHNRKVRKCIKRNANETKRSGCKKSIKRREIEYILIKLSRVAPTLLCKCEYSNYVHFFFLLNIHIWTYRGVLETILIYVYYYRHFIVL